MLERINKLRGRSWTELWFRGKQALAAFSERQGLSSQLRVPTDVEFFRLFDERQFSHFPDSTEGLFTHFRTQKASTFFAAFDDPEATQEELRNHFGTDRERLIKHADSIIEGRFYLFGKSEFDFGNPIDWHLEPVSRKRSPLLHWSLIDEIDAVASGDKKIVWELNRHQYFATLGRAYWTTGDERYAKTFATQLSEWMDQNPPKLGLNWMSSLEVAFRAISWLWALNFFKDSTHLSPELYTRVLKYLYLHARHLETYLSTYSSPNTHLTGEALGLFYLGTVLPEFRDAARWREKGRAILLDELKRHVLADGVYFERASYYHRYTTDFYIHFLILSELNRTEIPEEVRAKLQSLLDHLMYITRPDGTTPLVGDDDGGQLAMLDGREANDFRALLSTGAALFQRADYKYVAGDAAESTLWLLGREGLRTFEGLVSHPPQEASRAFPDGGYYVMRDGWTSDANYLLLDCGAHGVLNCGHAHADALSFELAARGRTLLVDSGTYTYTGSPELRDYFRSSAAHNTLTIDEESSSVSDGPFSWKETANASIIAWKRNARFDFLIGEHDGYKRLVPSPAIHTRSVLFLKNNYWVMRDVVKTNGTHQYDLHFHFAADSDASLEQFEGTTASATERAADKSGLQIFSFTDNGDWRIENGWVSSCYGERSNAAVCTFSSKSECSQEFFSFLIPRRVNDTRVSVREIEAIGGHAFEIKDKGSFDVALVCNSNLIESNRIKSDFKWAWVRFADDEETLEELVLIDGRSFSFDGQEILNLSKHVDYVVARRNDDKLLFEIDDRILEVALPSGDLVTASSNVERKPKI